MKISNDMRTSVRTKLLAEIIDDMRDALEAYGECDHSVGICSCAMRDRVLELEATCFGGRNLTFVPSVDEHPVRRVVHNDPFKGTVVFIKRKPFMVRLNTRGFFVREGA